MSVVVLENPKLFSDKAGNRGLRFDVRFMREETLKDLQIVRGCCAAWGRLRGPVATWQGSRKTQYTEMITFCDEVREQVLDALRRSGWVDLFPDVQWPPEVVGGGT